MDVNKIRQSTTILFMAYNVNCFDKTKPNAMNRRMNVYEGGVLADERV